MQQFKKGEQIYRAKRLLSIKKSKESILLPITFQVFSGKLIGNQTDIKFRLQQGYGLKTTRVSVSFSVR